MKTPSFAQIVKAVELLAKINWRELEKAVRARDLHEELFVAEELLDVISVFFPPAADLKSALQVIDFLNSHGHPADPLEPAMMKATGNDWNP